MPMNVLILSSRANIVPMVRALLRSRATKPNLFRVGEVDEVGRLLSWAACDLLVVDVGADGYGRRFDEASLRGQHPGLPIVLLDAGDAAPAVASDRPTDALLQAIRLISPHAELVAPRAREHAPPAARAAAPVPASPVIASPGSTLTTRQRDVLRLLRQGCSTREIAAALDVAVPTVKSHLRALYRYLGASNRLEAVLKAEPSMVGPAPRAVGLRVVA